MKKTAIGVVITAVLFSWLGFHVGHGAGIDRANESWREFSTLTEIERNLRVPSEALYWNYDVATEAEKVLLEDYSNHGIETLLPYFFVSRGGTLPDAHRSVGPGEIVESSSVRWWVYHTSEYCKDLRLQIASGQRIGNFLKSHPNAYPEVLRPLLARLTGFRERHARL
ncbi:MAG: hypothetical protein AAF517_16965, partial [Planctomycetota bacterium]